MCLLSKNLSKLSNFKRLAIWQDMSQCSKIASARQWFTIWSMVCIYSSVLKCRAFNKRLNGIFLREFIERLSSGDLTSSTFFLKMILKVKKKLIIKWFIYCPIPENILP